jgi:hypothetical protein
MTGLLRYELTSSSGTIVENHGGLEQAFNSLDAQREACAAFILSHKHEGWTMLPTLYDDGGVFRRHDGATSLEKVDD